jgi:putative transposase
VGWSIADHIGAELVADAIDMGTLRRRPPEGRTIAHSDHGSLDQHDWEDRETLARAI